MKRPSAVMRISDSSPHMLITFAAAAMLAGCGGSQPPIGAAGALPQTSAIAAQAKRGGSWMLPEAKSEDLLYVANGNVGTLTVYGYRKRNLVGTIDVGPYGTETGECVDKTGDVYVTSGSYTDILEFAHGGTEPIATLQDNGFPPFACSVDFQSGDLAVANLHVGYYSTRTPGNVTVFRKHHHTETYTDSALYYVDACGYDDHGNLLVSGGPQGTRGSYQVAFAVLPKGAHRLVNITLGQNQGNWPLIMGIQWDGKYWAITVPVQNGSETVYRYSIVNGKAKARGETGLGGDAGYYGQTWITRRHTNDHKQGVQLVAALGAASDVQYYKYPAGGEPFALINDGGYPDGVTVSLVQR